METERLSTVPALCWTPCHAGSRPNLRKNTAQHCRLVGVLRHAQVTLLKVVPKIKKGGQSIKPCRDTSIVNITCNRLEIIIVLPSTFCIYSTLLLIISVLCEPK